MRDLSIIRNGCGELFERKREQQNNGVDNNVFFVEEQQDREMKME
jgi:hypothetical protein